MSVQEGLRKHPLYFLALMAMPSVVALSHAYEPLGDVFKGQNLGIVVGLTMCLAVVVLWAIYRSQTTWNSWSPVVLLGAVLLWLWEFGWILYERTGFNYLALAPPVFFILILWKRPLTRYGSEFFSVLGISVVIVALFAYVAGALGVMPDGFAGPEGGIPTRYPWLAELIGADSRWIGPFGSVNFTSAAGGLAVVAGLAASGLIRWPCIAGGALMLLLSQGDSAMLAMALSILVFLLWGSLGTRWNLSPGVRLGVFGVVGAVAAVAVARFDGALNVRLETWENFLALWWESPVFGIGMNRVYGFINANAGTEGFAPYTHAHSVVLNGMTLYGLVWGVLYLGIVGAIAVQAYRAVPRVGSGPLAVVVYVLISGLAETTHSWTSVSLYVAALLAVLATTADPGPQRRAAVPSDYPVPSSKGGS